MSESRMRVGLAVATPPLLVAMAWGSQAVAAPVVVTAVLAVLAASLGYVVLFDFPVAIELEEEGVARICLLRRDLLTWEDIVGITRPRRRGVVALTRQGKQRILLDRALEEDEIALIADQAGLRGVETAL